MIQLNTIENELKIHDFASLYNINLRQVIDDIYNELMSDDKFVEQMGQKLNSKSDLYDMYKEKLEGIVINLIHPEEGDSCMTLYNILTDDFTFYVKWRMEMFELNFKTIRDMNTLYDAEEWFVQTDFDTMEEISNIYRDDFPYGEDGDQDFVDAVDEWWGKLSDEEKIEVYNNNK